MSDDQRHVPDPPEWMATHDLSGFPEFSDRDTACHVLPDLDYDSQLLAIRGLLAQHEKADEAVRRDIKEIEAFAKKTSGIRNEFAVSEWIERLHHSVYQDAAHSMAAVGVIAPFVESIFYHAFQEIGRQMTEKLSCPSDHKRWQRPAEDQWDCHFVWTNGRRKPDLVQGIMQLAEAVEMTKFFPNDLGKTLEALFAYRNKMFHCGFEWPVEERRRFHDRIANEKWSSDWFSIATSGGRPWVFYMSETFIQHCLNTIEQVLTGIGAFSKKQFMPALRRQEDTA